MVIAVDPYLLLYCSVKPTALFPVTIPEHSRNPTSTLATTTQTPARHLPPNLPLRDRPSRSATQKYGPLSQPKNHTFHQLAAAVKSNVAPATWVSMPCVSAPGAVDASPAQGSGGRPEVPSKVARLRCVGSLLALMCAARLCVGCGGFAYVCFRRQVTKVGIMLLAWASSGAGRGGMACGRAPECITSPSSFLGPLPRPCPSFILVVRAHSMFRGSSFNIALCQAVML